MVLLAGRGGRGCRSLFGGLVRVDGRKGVDKGSGALTCPVDLVAWGGKGFVRVPEEGGRVGEVAGSVVRRVGKTVGCWAERDKGLSLTRPV